MMIRKGRDIFLEVLQSEGVTHIFGNPGTTELPLIDALAQTAGIHYVLGLQEATVVGMADGYAQATRRPAFVNLHTAAGLGNGMGNLTNAKQTNVPLVVTAGQQDYRHLLTDPFLSGDLTEIAAPIAKWTHQIHSTDEIALILRRAFHDAASPPSGPVFVSLPMNLLDEQSEAELPVPSQIERRAVGGSLDLLSDLLVSTDRERLVMVVGDEVAFSQATEATVKVAETLGIRVFGAPMYSNNPFPTAHSLWAGMLPPQATAIRATLTNIDRVFLIGGRAFMVYPYSPGSALPTGAELLHLSPDPLQLGRAYATRLGIVGDPRATLEALLPLLQTRVDSEQAQVAIAHARTAYEARQTDLELQVQRQVSKVPMPPVVAAHALIRALPPDTIVVDEAPIATNEVRAFHRVHSASRYFFCRGGGLGWGMPAALGISLGYDREPVLCVVGDGSALYSPQALWTAMHEQLPVVFVVINNRGYGILKDALRTMYEHHPQARPFVGMDIIDPPIDFVALSRSMGVASTRVERVNEVGDAVRTALVTGKPHLIEIVLA